MNIHEYQAAEILGRYGIPVNPGEVAESPDQAEEIARRFGTLVAVKSQVHIGGRGKAGGIKIAKTPAAARDAAEAILGMDIKGHTVNKVLIARGADIAREFYLGVVLDRPKRQITIMASAEGGVDIEEVARERPEKIVRALADPFIGLQPWQARQIAFELGLPADKVNGFAAIVLKLYAAYIAEDATLAEINPLILTGGGEWLALDSKMSFDDNALFRIPHVEELRDMA
ncbi:MAG: ATP-grasp domain-containing protein, partial [Thermomicrobiales bacterium]